jgi:uncharacterized membrane protein
MDAIKLKNTIIIAAPRSVVWDVTVDVEGWPQWAPTFSSVKRLDKGPFDVGSSALIKQPGLPPAKWVVSSLTPGERFTWESRVRGIHMIATHELTTHPAGTQNVLRVELRGLVARLLWPLICFPASRSLQRENAGLKAKCEAIPSTR